MGAVKNIVGGGKGGIGAVLGGAAGFALGGPMGGMIGSSIGGSLGGGMDQAEAAKQGAKAQQAAANAAIAEQQAARQQMSAALSPYRREGVDALNLLTGTRRTPGIAGQAIDMTSLPQAQLGQLGPLPSVLPQDIGQDSLFQALKREAITGIESSAAARGKLFSGSTPQAIADKVQNLALARSAQIQGMNLAARQQLVGERGEIFGQDLSARQALLGERIAENERRYQQLFNIANLGQASAAQQAANIGSTASNIGSLMTQGANAAAAGRIGAANAQAQALGSLIQAGTTLGAASMMSGNPLFGARVPPPTSPGLSYDTGRFPLMQ